MRGRARGRGACEQGAAAVEMALVLPLLLLIVFGIIDFGFAFNAQISLTQATREGVRVGALGEAPSVTLMETRMRESYFGIISQDVPAAIEGASNACSATPDPDDPPARLVSQLEFTTPIARFGTTLRAEAVMRCGG
jgi:hypothetical protein